MSLEIRSKPPYLDQTLGLLMDTRPSTVVFKLPSSFQCSFLKIQTSTQGGHQFHSTNNTSRTKGLVILGSFILMQNKQSAALLIHLQGKSHPHYTTRCQYASHIPSCDLHSPNSTTISCLREDPAPSNNSILYSCHPLPFHTWNPFPEFVHGAIPWIGTFGPTPGPAV